jgi:hypothetical protein
VDRIAEKSFANHKSGFVHLQILAIMAVAILVCTGLTVDLRFVFFPTAAVFLLAGITIGRSDRHKLRQAVAGGDIDEAAGARHA